MKSKRHLLLNSVLLIIWGLIFCSSLRADLDDSKNLSATKIEQINKFVNDYLVEAYKDSVIGEDLMVEVSQPVKFEGVVSPRFKNWKFYSISWVTWHPKSELNSYPEFQIRLAESPKSKFYPIFSFGDEATQFVKLWNENFELLTNEEKVCEFYQAHCEVMNINKVIVKVENPEPKFYRIFGSKHSGQKRRYFRELTFSENGLIDKFVLESQKLSE